MAANDPILVTGAAGFISSHLAYRLVQLGRELVTAVRHAASGWSPRFPHGR